MPDKNNDKITDHAGAELPAGDPTAFSRAGSQKEAPSKEINDTWFEKMSDIDKNLGGGELPAGSPASLNRGL